MLYSCLLGRLRWPWSPGLGWNLSLLRLVFLRQKSRRKIELNPNFLAYRILRVSQIQPVAWAGNSKSNEHKILFGTIGKLAMGSPVITKTSQKGKRTLKFLPLPRRIFHIFEIVLETYMTQLSPQKFAAYQKKSPSPKILPMATQEIYPI